MPFVIEGGFGDFSKEPLKIADTISDWLRDDDLLARMSNNAKKASRPMVRLSIRFPPLSKLKTPDDRPSNTFHYILKLSRATASGSCRSVGFPVNWSCLAHRSLVIETRRYGISVLTHR